MTKEYIEKEINFYKKEREELLKKYKNISNKLNIIKKVFFSLLIIYLGIISLYLINSFNPFLSYAVAIPLFSSNIILIASLQILVYKKDFTYRDLSSISSKLNFNQKLINDLEKTIKELNKKDSNNNDIVLKDFNNNKEEVKTKKLIKTK